QWLTYSRAAQGPDILTVEFKTDRQPGIPPTTIYRYDSSKNPAIQTTTGLPIYKVTSTGIEGGNRTKIVTEVIQKPFNVLVNAAFAADNAVTLSGTSWICGHNHSGSTPTNTTGAACAAYHTTNDLPGVWSSGTITNNNPGQNHLDGWPTVSIAN